MFVSAALNNIRELLCLGWDISIIVHYGNYGNILYVFCLFDLSKHALWTSEYFSKVVLLQHYG